MAPYYGDGKPPTELQELARILWQKTGDLSRTASLLDSLQCRHPNLRVSNDIDNAIGIILAEIDFLRADYKKVKERILAKRGQQQIKEAAK